MGTPRERPTITVSRSEHATVYEAADLGIRTAAVVPRDGWWEARCYLGPDGYDADLAATREVAEEAALGHSLHLAR